MAEMKAISRDCVEIWESGCAVEWMYRTECQQALVLMDAFEDDND